MSRMNGKKRNEAYELLGARDGEFCAICGKAGSSETLVVDHIDNNNSNNDPDNWQLLCRSCNSKKNPRGASKPKNDSFEIHEPPSSEEIIRNKKYEPVFREWLEKLISKYKRVSLKDVISAGAEITGASLITIERYLEKLCSFAGKFRVIVVDGVKYVEFKPWWNGK